MSPTPKSLRLHIGIFGRRNVGKSSLLNAMTRQAVSIVSDVAGTTTDPVEKPMELLPLGPVLFIDTAGIDDAGALGELRVAKTRQVLDRTDVAILVAEAGSWGPFEQGMLDELAARKTPTIVAFNKSDLCPAGPGFARSAGDCKCPDSNDGRIRGRGRAGTPRGPDPSRTGGFPQRRVRALGSRPAGRTGGPGRADRQGGAQGPADRPAGAVDPRPARSRRILPGGQGA